MSQTGQRQGEGTVGKASGDGGWKELVIVAGILVALTGGAMGIYWLSTGGGKADATEKRGVPEPSPAATVAPAVNVAPTTATAPAAAMAVMSSEATYADIYFDFKSTRLRADSVAVLQDKARTVKDGEGWIVIVQGYADHQGPAEYNKILAQRRAQSVKQFLVELGVPDTAVKVVTVGQEGALCDDPGKECQQLNRRVHIEMRKLALATPVRATVTEGDRLLVDQSVSAPTVTKPEAK